MDVCGVLSASFFRLLRAGTSVWCIAQPGETFALLVAAMGCALDGTSSSYQYWLPRV